VEEEQLISESEDEQLIYENNAIESPEHSEKDPILETIGDFGLYQLYVCVVGFFFTIPHCWVSLSLKFVGMRTNFTCVDSVVFNASDPLRYNDYCGEHCQNFQFDETQFRGTIVERWNLVCDKGGLDSIAQSVFFAGCLIGVFAAGVLADVFGRKPVLVGLISIFSMSGVLGGLTDSFYVWLALRFILGATTIGMNTVRYIIQIEMLGSGYRSWGSLFGALGWTAGYILLPVLAYAAPDMQQLEVFMGLTATPFLLLYWLYPESPKWLLSKGRAKEAEDIVEKICYWNDKKFKGLKVSVSPTKIRDKPESVGLMSLGGFPNIRRNLACMAFTWFSVGMTYFGIALHTPEFGSNVYMVFFLGGLLEIPTNIAGPWFLNHCGRKYTMMASFFTTAVCLFVSGVIPVGFFYKEWVTVTLIMVGKVGVGFCFESCYIWTSELFPTVIRNSSISVCSSFARLGAIIAPLIVEIDKDNPMAPILVYGFVAMAAGFNTYFLHPETKNCDNLPNSLDEGEAFADKRTNSKQALINNSFNSVNITPLQKIN